MIAADFLTDLEAKPATLRALADTIRAQDPWQSLTTTPRPSRPGRHGVVGVR